MPVPVLVVEDDSLVRLAVVHQIREGSRFEVAAAVGDLAGARTAIEADIAKLGIFDLSLPDGHAGELIALAVERGMAVLVLTVWDDDDNVYSAIAAGAGGYLLKGDASAGRVCDALQILTDGGAPISPVIARRLLDDFRGRARTHTQPPGSGELTNREREILAYFAKGATYDDVASLMHISVNTVRHHVRNLYRKLHVSSKVEAVSLGGGR